MPNLLTGLKYQTPLQEANTEAELLEVFTDLRETYERLSSTFKLTNHDGMPYETFREILEAATANGGRSILVNGSGDVGGIVIKDASLEYNLSSVAKITEFWDIHRDGGCHACKNHCYEQIGGEMENACRVRSREEMIWENNKCPDHAAKKQNAQGKPARKLAELVKEASE